MIRRNPLQAALAATAALVVAAIIGLVVAGGDDDGPSSLQATARSSTSSSSSSSSSSVVDETSTTAAPSSTVATTAPAAKTATTKAATATTAPAGAVQAPAPGTYRYLQEGSGAGGSTRNEYTLTIVAAPDEGTAKRRNVTSSADGRTDEQAWAPDKVTSLRASGSAPCTWNPARTLYLGTLSTGATWSIDSRCAKTTVQYPQTDRHEAQFRVTGREGNLWVIHFTERYSVTENNGQTTELQTSEGDIRFDAQRGLVVRRVESMHTHDLEGTRTLDTRLL
jgi:hypothetical protein